MKTLLTMTLVLLMAGTAFAQLENSMGIFFAEGDFSEAATNIDTAAAPFNAYVCLIEGQMVSIGGYEVGMSISDPAVFVLAVTGPNGWTNFGGNLNHLCGYTTPLVSSSGQFVLSTMNILQSVANPADMFMAPSEPSSVDGAGPAIADGANPDVLYTCNYTSGPDMGGIVATFNGAGIQFPGVATEAHSLSSVKALFN